MEYKKDQTIAKREIKKAKQSSFSEFCSNLLNKSPKDMWSDIKRFKTGINPSSIPRPSVSCGIQILQNLCPPFIPPFIPLDQTSQTDNSLIPFTPISFYELSHMINKKIEDSTPGRDGKCSKGILNKLDRVQFAAIRIALGCMRSTPTNILLSESGEYSLELRRSWLAYKLITKALRISDNIIIKNSFHSILADLIGNNIPPILKSFQHIINNNIDNTIAQDISLICFKPPLHAHFEPIRIRNLKPKKNDTNTPALFQEKISSLYPTYTRIFTDASKNYNTVGIGILVPI
ncbi:hypothetical protein HHI36_002901 [Cryptolaemus montrouzieri]|uniref:Reverse transcriptase/retrotransposon-derived protein RNase H-like domain-containing protein n=1 Tax=Cryptolaemus montrouzieri TaxID=559131 RepID=A0ABD2PCS7_9CUCU